MNLDRLLNQTVVYWPPTAPNKFGKPGFGTPVELRAHWEDKNEEFLGPTGTNLISSSCIYLAEAVKVGGVLWLGKLEDANATPLDNPGAAIIKRCDTLASVDAKTILRRVFA